MARVLLTLWPFPTHLNPFMALAHALGRRGHEVTFYTGGQAELVVAGEGFRCSPFRDVAWSQVQQTVDDLIAGRRDPSQTGRLWRRFLMDTVPLQLKDLDTLLNEWPPDVLICDLALWAPMLVLRETRRIPVVAFSHVANCLLPGPDGPVPGFPLPRKHNWLLSWWAWLGSKAVGAATAQVRRRADEIRGEHGLPPLGMTLVECAGTMPLYLVPSTPELDRLREDLPASVHYVGPCLWDKNPAQAPPAWLEELRGRRLILVDEGALYEREPRVLKLAAAALADLPQSVVLLAGFGRDPAALDLGRMANNVMLHAHAPLSDLLPFVEVLVTNGNSDSVLASLSVGVPVVVLPSIWDQAELAWRVHETGAGLRLPPRRTTPQRMRQAVELVLKEPSFRENARRMGAALARRGGPERAAELIEELIGLRQPGTSWKQPVTASRT